MSKKRDREILQGLVKRLCDGIRSSPEMNRERREFARAYEIKRFMDYQRAQNITILPQPRPNYYNSKRNYK